MRKETLGTVLKSVKRDKKLSYKDICEKSGGDLSLSHLYRIENAQIDPLKMSIGTLLAVARGLDLPAQSLFDLICGLENNEAAFEEISYLMRELPHERRDDILQIARLFHGNHNASLGNTRGPLVKRNGKQQTVAVLKQQSR